MRPLDEPEQRMVNNIEQYGRSIVGVFDPEHEIPNFAYSIGFSKSLGQGEVLISGLGLDTMKALLNDAYDLCHDGLKLADFARTSELFSSFDCVVRAIAGEYLRDEYLTSALWYSETYLGEPFTCAYQLVWPDKAGIFPWEDGFSQSLVGAQLELWRQDTLQ